MVTVDALHARMVTSVFPGFRKEGNCTNCRCRSQSVTALSLTANFNFTLPKCTYTTSLLLSILYTFCVSLCLHIHLQHNVRLGMLSRRFSSMSPQHVGAWTSSNHCWFRFDFNSLSLDSPPRHQSCHSFWWRWRCARETLKSRRSNGDQAGARGIATQQEMAFAVASRAEHEGARCSFSCCNAPPCLCYITPVSVTTQKE